MKKLPRFTNSGEALAWCFSNAQKHIDFQIYPGMGISEYYLSTRVLRTAGSLRCRALIVDDILPGAFHPARLVSRRLPELVEAFSQHGWEVRLIKGGNISDEAVLQVPKEFVIFDDEAVVLGNGVNDPMKPQEPPALLGGTPADKKALVYLFDKTWQKAGVFTQPDDDFGQTSSGGEFLALVRFGNKIRLVALSPDGKYRFLDREQNLHSIVYVQSSETLQLERAVEELEELVNDVSVKEETLQRFFERNPQLILNDTYSKAHPHVILATDEGRSLIPDFVLEPSDQNFLCDLLELKLPTSPVFIFKKNRFRLSSAVLEARAQLLEYSRFFNERKNQDAIHQTYGLRAWMPKLFLIIGRLGKIDALDRRIIEASQPDLYLRTYDDLINWTKAKIDRMKNKGLGR